MDNRPERFWEDHAKFRNKISYPFKPHLFYMLAIVGKFGDFTNTLLDPCILGKNDSVAISEKELKLVLAYFVRLNWLLRNDEAYRMNHHDINALDVYESNKFLIEGLERLEKSGIHIYNKPQHTDQNIRDARDSLTKMSNCLVDPQIYQDEYGKILNDSMRSFFMYLSLLSIIVTGKQLADIALEDEEELKKSYPEKFNQNLYGNKLT